MPTATSTYCVCPNCGAEAPARNPRCNECGHRTYQKPVEITAIKGPAAARSFRL